jgi:hypothetical protein
MKFDLNEISALLHIHEKAMGHPKLKSIADAAMKHLETMADETARPEAMVESEAEDLAGHDGEGSVDQSPGGATMRRL